jgi:nitrogen fixation-related uncharacterized protein
MTWIVAAVVVAVVLFAVGLCALWLLAKEMQD